MKTKIITSLLAFVFVVGNNMPITSHHILDVTRLNGYQPVTVQRNLVGNQHSNLQSKLIKIVK